MTIRNAKQCVNLFLRREQRDCAVTFERLKVKGLKRAFLTQLFYRFSIKIL